MRVVHLGLTDFRNYEAVEVDFSAGPNLFVGSNGQGKTNLVESLGYLSTLGSHRVPSDHAMIRQGQDSAIVRARLEHDGRPLLAEVQINRIGANRAQINRGAIKMRDLPRYFSSVLFAPEDLAIVRGDPAGRRRFLDSLLGLRLPRYQGVFSDYDRVLKQRNTLLKSARASGVRADHLATLDIWDERLVDLGSQIIVGRAELVADLLPDVTAAYISVAGRDQHATMRGELSILGAGSDDGGTPTSVAQPASSPPITVEEAAEAFRGSLQRVRRAELDRALTLVGPHRDDITLELNEMPARGYASHGESWSFALALKLASAQLLRRDSSMGDPVVILDDVFAELDASRRVRLAAAVIDFEQTLITAAVFADVPTELTTHTTRIAAGAVVES